MLRYIISIMVLALSVMAQQSDHARENFRISGTAVDAATGQPLDGIEVFIGPAEKPGIQKTKTDNQGHFEFNGLAKGKYWLAAQGHGFPQQAYDEHEGFSSAMVVGNEDVTSEGIVFRLRPGASISGVITDNFNETVRQAQIMLFHAAIFNGKRTTAMAQQVSSNDQGHYHFSHLPAGSYFVAVFTKPWYAQNPPTSVNANPEEGGQSADNNKD